MSATRILAAAFCLSALCSAPGLIAQTNPQLASATAAQPFDASNLREPVGIGTQGLVEAGDDPAYAQPGFDDSKWLPVDAKTAPGGYFSHNQPDVVWQRLHIKVGPDQGGLALQLFGSPPACEVYVNGQELMVSGQVEPFVPFTGVAVMIVRIPDAQIRTGSLVIAARSHFTRTWWTSSYPGFTNSLFLLGWERTLRDEDALYVIRANAGVGVEEMLGLGVGFVALVFFAAQRRHFEYFWIFMMGAAGAVACPLWLLMTTRNVPSWLLIFFFLVEFLQEVLFLLLVCQAFLPTRFSRRMWLFAAVSGLLSFSATAANSVGALPLSYVTFAQFPVDFLTDILLPWLFLRQLRRGNREAGILFFPLVFWGLHDYLFAVAALQHQIPAFGSEAGWYSLINSLKIGIFTFDMDRLGILSFWCSLAVIMVLRFKRTSRQQAVLEGEMAAAREVQQVILPEQVETIPGFTVESVYQPAQQVGGDFFQILPTGEGGLLVVVGDVAGKGLPAAMLVSVLVGAIRGVAEYTKDPAELLANLNDRLVGRGGGGFSTALVARISAAGIVMIANAGHLSPYLDGREVELPGALPLGVMNGVAYETTQFALAPGSRLTFYSDGVVEAQNQKGELFGFDRARDLSSQPAAAIVEAAKQFGQEDDITVVTIERDMPIAAVA
jgi:hypothetical protein